jgi:hypothetical protein
MEVLLRGVRGLLAASEAERAVSFPFAFSMTRSVKTEGGSSQHHGENAGHIEGGILL